jgi:hypothetical protein
MMTTYRSVGHHHHHVIFFLFTLFFAVTIAKDVPLKKAIPPKMDPIPYVVWFWLSSNKIVVVR